MSKKNLILLSVLILLSAGVYFYTFIYQAKLATKQTAVNFLQNINSTDIDKLTISTKGKQIILLKRGDNWRIDTPGEFYTSDQLTSQLTQTLSELSSSSLTIASLAPDNKSSFASDQASGTQVSLWQGDRQLGDFIVGKTIASYTYLSRSSDDRTYASLLDLSFLTSQDDWRDKTIFNDDPNGWQSLTIKNNLAPASQLQLVKKGEQWFDQSGKIKLNTDKVRALLNLLSSLSADSLPEQKLSGTGLDKADITVTASGNGLKNTLLIGKSKGEEYYAKKDGLDNIYLINKKKVEVLLTDLDKLK